MTITPRPGFCPQILQPIIGILAALFSIIRIYRTTVQKLNIQTPEQHHVRVAEKEADGLGSL